MLWTSDIRQLKGQTQNCRSLTDRRVLWPASFGSGWIYFFPWSASVVCIAGLKKPTRYDVPNLGSRHSGCFQLFIVDIAPRSPYDSSSGNLLCCWKRGVAGWRFSHPVLFNVALKPQRSKCNTVWHLQLWKNLDVWFIIVMCPDKRRLGPNGWDVDGTTWRFCFTVELINKEHFYNKRLESHLYMVIANEFAEVLRVASQRKHLGWGGRGFLTGRAETEFKIAIIFGKFPQTQVINNHISGEIWIAHFQCGYFSPCYFPSCFAAFDIISLAELCFSTPDALIDCWARYCDQRGSEKVDVMWM